MLQQSDGPWFDSGSTDFDVFLTQTDRIHPLIIHIVASLVRCPPSQILLHIAVRVLVCVSVPVYDIASVYVCVCLCVSAFLCADLRMWASLISHRIETLR